MGCYVATYGCNVAAAVIKTAMLFSTESDTIVVCRGGPCGQRSALGTLPGSVYD